MSHKKFDPAGVYAVPHELFGLKTARLLKSYLLYPIKRVASVYEY